MIRRWVGRARPLLLLLAWPWAAAQSVVAPDTATAAEADKSWAIPAGEIVAFQFLLNRFNRRFSGTHDYDVTWSTIRSNLRGPWVVDNDPFNVNQFGHPVQGSIYHGFGRSAGLSYWESSALTFAGSVLWEIAGEKTPPSRNDQVASGIAGSFLGEPLFRMAHLVLDRSDLPAAWRPWIAGAISPPVALNRLAFGSRLDGTFSDHDPAYYGRMHVGVTHAVQNDFDPSPEFRRNALQADFALDYGLPGKPGYTYTRPFDYFAVQVLFSTANGVENLSTRGLLKGTDYAIGDSVRGLWGLYANYDYLSPQIFHVSTTSLSLGSTAQWWVSRDVALQGTALAGLGYAAASTARWATQNLEYHYGVASRAALAMRAVAADRAAIDISARVVSLGSLNHRADGRDEISRVDTAFTWRIQGPHAVSLNYVWSHRSAAFPGTDGRHQTLGRVGLYYTLLGQHGFGAVDWRTPRAE